MTLEILKNEMLAEGEARGVKKGIKQGIQQGVSCGREEEQNRLMTLIQKMTEAGETSQLPRLAEMNFLQDMFRKYQL